MKCPKCNANIEDNSMFCSKCGANLAQLYSDEVIEEPIEDVVDEATDDEVEQPDEQALELTEDEFEGEELVFVEPKKKFDFSLKKKNGEKGITKFALILIIVAGVLGTLLVIGGVTSAIYFNSSTYKIHKAVSLIEDKQYGDAYNALAGVTGDTADAMRNYVSIPQALDKYKADYETVGYVIVNDEYAYLVENMNSFCELVANYGETNKVEALPDELKAEYDYLKKTCESASSIDLTIDFTSSMSTFQNDIICNQSPQFTLDNVQVNIDNTNSGLESLATNIGLIADASKDNAPLDLSAQFFTNYKADYDRFVNACTASVNNYNTTIQTAKNNNYSMQQPVTNKNKNPNYKATIIHNLNPVGSIDDINSNAQIMNNTLCVTLFEYYISSMPAK